MDFTTYRVYVVDADDIDIHNTSFHEVKETAHNYYEDENTINLLKYVIKDINEYVASNDYYFLVDETNGIILN